MSISRRRFRFGWCSCLGWRSRLGTTGPLDLRAFNLRALGLRSFGIALALCRLCRPVTLFLLSCSRLPLDLLLALNALAQLTLQFARRLRLLSLLARLIFLPLPGALRLLSFTLLLSFKLLQGLALLQGFTLPLSLTYLSIAILPHQAGNCAPIENRGLRAWCRFGGWLLGTGRAITDTGYRCVVDLAASRRAGNAIR